MLRSRAVCLGALWLGLMVHLDWHLGRPGHDALSFHLPWHWLLAVPAFLPIAWMVKRRWPDAALKAGLVVVLLGLLIGQGLEPLGESLLGAGTEPFTNPLRWRAFAEFVGAGVLTLLFAAPLIRRAGRATPPAGRVGWCLLLLLGQAPPVQVAWAQGIIRVRQIHFPFVEFAIVSDTISGVGLAAAPVAALQSRGREQPIIWLTLHPDSMGSWLREAETLLRFDSAPESPPGANWLRPLPGAGGEGRLRLGRWVAGGIRTDAIVAPSDDRAGWQVRLSAEETLSLVARLGEARAESRRDSAIIAAWDKDTVDSPVQPRRQRMEAVDGRSGRVLVQFVVDTNGRADMHTFTVILASDATLEGAARAIIRRSRFEPATRHGRPVPQLVMQQLAWYQQGN